MQEQDFINNDMLYTEKHARLHSYQIEYSLVRERLQVYTSHNAKNTIQNIFFILREFVTVGYLPIFQTWGSYSLINKIMFSLILFLCFQNISNQTF